MRNEMNSVINSVLANLEVAAIFMSSELQAAALLDRRPHERQSLHLDSKHDLTLILINEAHVHLVLSHGVKMTLPAWKRLQDEKSKLKGKSSLMRQHMIGKTRLAILSLD